MPSSTSFHISHYSSAIILVFSYLFLHPCYFYARSFKDRNRTGVGGFYIVIITHIFVIFLF